MVDLLSLELESVLVEGCHVRYRRLGPRGPGRPLILLHGSGAHAGWWTEVAPLLALRHDVVVLELSGHGDSDRRTVYEPPVWEAEILAVIEHLGGETDLVGHSMGGLASIYAASAAPSAVARLVLVDTPIARVVRADVPMNTKVYASQADAVADFRLRPPGTSADPELLELIARANLRREGDGWMWSVDSATRQRYVREEIEERIPRIAAAVSFVYGSESSLVDEAAGYDLARRLGREVPIRAVEGAYHHVPLDRPEECAHAIDEVLALTDRPRVTPCHHPGRRPL